MELSMYKYLQTLDCAMQIWVAIEGRGGMWVEGTWQEESSA